MGVIRRWRNNAAGQMTIELAAALPVLMIVAMIAVNAIGPPPLIEPAVTHIALKLAASLPSHTITPGLYESTTYEVVWTSRGMSTPNTCERNPMPNKVGENSSVAV